MSLIEMLIIIVLLLAAMIVGVVQTKKLNNKKKEQDIMLDYYEIPKFKPLTEEKIKDIHSRGKITPKEKVEEWESFGLCAPGDAIGSAAWRCKKFDYCCHDCLIDYANEKDEYDKLDLKIVHHIPNNN